MISLKKLSNSTFFKKGSRLQLTFNKILCIKLSGLGNSVSFSDKKVVTRCSPNFLTKIAAIVFCCSIEQ